VELPEIYRRKALRLEGFGDDEVQRMLRAGDLTPVRRGSYVREAVPEDLDSRHALRVRAQLGHLDDGAVVSHASAAVLHGLPTWGMRLQRVHVTRDRRNGGRTRPGLHVHTAPLHADDIVGGAGWIGTVDFGWPEKRTIGEFDGKEKYGRLLRPGRSPADAVYAEKLREDALRAEGLSMVRWGWDALPDFGPTAARLWRFLRG
jgi:hypothetical protein